MSVIIIQWNFPHTEKTKQKPIEKKQNKKEQSGQATAGCNKIFVTLNISFYVLKILHIQPLQKLGIKEGKSLLYFFLSVRKNILYYDIIMSDIFFSLYIKQFEQFCRWSN